MKTWHWVIIIGVVLVLIFLLVRANNRRREEQMRLMQQQQMQQRTNAGSLIGTVGNLFAGMLGGLGGDKPETTWDDLAEGGSSESSTAG